MKYLHDHFPADAYGRSPERSRIRKEKYEQREGMYRWRKARAKREYKYYLNHLPALSADMYKESRSRFYYHGREGRRRGRYPFYKWAHYELIGDDQWGDALSQKRASIRHRWHLNSRAQIL